jgi:glycosyltransferase involved in cell wall biosynthesis
MKKLKVLQIVGAPAGGIRKHIIDILKQLPQEQFEVALATSLKDADKVFISEYAHIQKLCQNRLYNIHMNKKPSFGDLKNLYLLWKMIKQEKYDIIHGHGAKGGLYSRFLGLFLGAKVIYTPHGGSLHSMHGKVKNKVFALIERGLYYLTDRLIFESDYSRQTYFDKVYKADKKSVVNYNGVEISHVYAPRSALSKERVTKICAFGILRYVKGHDILIRAVKELITQGYPIEVNIYGSGEEQKTLQSLIDTLHLENSVYLRGETDRALEIMAQYDILVHPSRFESFGSVVVEAMSVGLPVIAASVGGLTEIIEHNINGLLIPENTSDNLVEAIKTLIDSENIAAQLAFQGYERCQNRFDLRHMIEQLSKIYEEK